MLGYGVLTFYEGGPKVAVDYEQQTGNMINHQNRMFRGQSDKTKRNDTSDIVILECEYIGSYILSNNLILRDDFSQIKINKTIGEAKEQLKSKVNGLYPDLIVEIKGENI